LLLCGSRDSLLIKHDGRDRIVLVLAVVLVLEFLF